MQSAAVVALALLESASAFQAPAAAMRSVSRASATMFSEGDLGVLPPLGVFDPLGLIETRDMRRYEIMEIKQMSVSNTRIAGRSARSQLTSRPLSMRTSLSAHAPFRYSRDGIQCRSSRHAL